MTAAWIGVGVEIPRAVSIATKCSDRPSSAKEGVTAGVSVMGRSTLELGNFGEWKYPALWGALRHG